MPSLPAEEREGPVQAEAPERHAVRRQETLLHRVQRSADVFDNMSNELARAGTSASTKFTNETLPEVHRLVTDLRDVTDSLRRVGDQLEQNPSILLYGKPSEKRGPGE